ncbi:double zinc ribbon domain-containing protein [Geosporobacter ferrireducens]|uniref:DZANK-type domain-containing protein n=1 Tax=Geosporobacter ferrireducens TaxID=1424294 RepID=A0A1D8GE24_9FIRM|nr:zinc ribbon domain-containing protein [Geosporobacter ferrireducens]AOT69161.1 hypothetical protein Gferi_06045 [Geosporobacter ferrireducens]MTI56838.1 zinc ribbon domain-containing protein [Geosporobacter ferrireducens]
MWETIKNDPLLKVITILIFGVLGFGFAFNIMFGRNIGGMGHDGMGGAYPLENTLAYILSIAVKILLIAIVLAAIITVFKASKKYLVEGNAIKMPESFKNDPVLKGASVLLLSLLALGVITVLFNSMFGFSPRFYYAQGNGYGFGGTSLMFILARLLLLISGIGFVVAIVFSLRENHKKLNIKNISLLKSKEQAQVICSTCQNKTVEEHEFCPNCGKKLKEKCSNCQSELKAAWKCCPNCGNERLEDGILKDLNIQDSMNAAQVKSNTTEKAEEKEDQ